MTDLELCEIAARWLGISYHISGNYIMVEDDKPDDEGDYNMAEFDPLHDRNDLDKVVVKLLDEGYKIQFGKAYTNKFTIVHIDNPYYKEGIYPDDFPRAVLELVAELYKEKIPQSNEKYFECPECGSAVPHGMKCHHNLHG